MNHPSILFLIRSLNYGGSERQLVALTRGLWAQGHAVAVATFYPNGPLGRELQCAGVPVYSLGKRSRWRIGGFFYCLFRLVRELRPTVLHGYLASANILAVALKIVFPSLKVAWGVRASNMELERYGWLDRLLYWIECRLSRFADLIVVNSRAGYDYAEAHGFPASKMVVIPNGIDVQRFRPDPAMRERFRKEWRVPEPQQIIGLVGRLDPMKGHDTFLHAASGLVRDRKDVRFVCIGDGPEHYRQSLISLTEQLGLRDQVLWLNARDDVELVYNALDVVTACSSYGEGFSNVLGEAMACGVPCVATDVGDARWIVGDTCPVVKPRDPEALASAWKELLDIGPEERARLGLRARERVVQCFSVGRLIEETASALKTLS